MRVIRNLLAGGATAVATAGLALAFAAPAQAAPVASEVQLCRLTVGNVTALDLQENAGDEIFLRLNNQRFPGSTLTTVKFTAPGQTQPPSEFENPTKVFAGTMTVQLNEKDFLEGDEIDSHSFACRNRAESAVQYLGLGAIYLVDVKVEVI